MSCRIACEVAEAYRTVVGLSLRLRVTPLVVVYHLRVAPGLVRSLIDPLHRVMPVVHEPSSVIQTYDSVSRPITDPNPIQARRTSILEPYKPQCPPTTAKESAPPPTRAHNQSQPPPKATRPPSHSRGTRPSSSRGRQNSFGGARARAAAPRAQCRRSMAARAR